MGSLVAEVSFKHDSTYVICIIWLFITWVFPLLVFCGFPARCIETYVRDYPRFKLVVWSPALCLQVSMWPGAEETV